jgi:hypothetical protein
MDKTIMKFDAPELNAIEKSKAEQIKSTFEPMAEMLSQFEEAYNNVVTEAKKEITKEVTAKAKRLRLDIGKVRIETEKVRKEQKEEYLRAGKAIDGVSNILKWAVSDKENKLKEIENYFEIQEQKRLEELQAMRVEELSKYVEDAHERDLSSMDCDVWEAYFQSKKREYEDRIAAEKKAEEERIAKEKAEALRQNRESELKLYWQFVPEIHPSFETLSKDEWNDFLEEMKFSKQKYDDDQEKIRKENERLQKEAEEKERQRQAELKAIRDREEKERVEREAKAEAERKRIAEQEAKLRAEKEEAERKLREAKETEEKRIAQIEADKQAELNKGDADKVHDLIIDLKDLKTKYVFKSKANKEMFEGVCWQLDNIISKIK